MARDVYAGRRLRYHPVTKEDGTVVEYVSVTSITGILDKPALNDWRAKMGKEGMKISKETSDMGSTVHAQIEYFLKTGNMPINPTGFFKAFLQFYQDLAPEKTVMVESLVWNHEKKYAGRVDVVFQKAGKLLVTDWKTSKDGRIYVEHPMQVSAYAYAIGHMLGLPFDKMDCLIIKLLPGGEYYPYHIRDWHAGPLGGFLNCLDELRWLMTWEGAPDTYSPVVRLQEWNKTPAPAQAA